MKLRKLHPEENETSQHLAKCTSIV